jgi:hypothetical protein
MPLPAEIYSFFSRRKGTYYVIAAAAITVLVYPISRQWWTLREERRLFAIHTAMDDLDILTHGKRKKSKKIEGTAVIVGGRSVLSV